MDAIHYHVRSEGEIIKKLYVLLLGLAPLKKRCYWNVGWKNESAKFWLSKLNELKSRGVEDILIACVDGLTGFPIEAIYPQTQIQPFI